MRVSWAGPVLVLLSCLIGATVLVVAHFDVSYASAPIAGGLPSGPPHLVAPLRTTPAPSPASASPRRTSRRLVSVVFQGVRLEVLGLGWFLLAFFAEIGFSNRGPGTGQTVRSHLFCLPVPAMAAVFYSIHQAGFHLAFIGPLYLLAAACIAVIFCVAAVSEQQHFNVFLTGLPADALRAVRHPLFWALVAVFIGVSTRPIGLAGAGTLLTPENVGAWSAQQRRVEIPVERAGAAVVVVVFRDFQCSPCKAAHQSCDAMIARLAAEHRGAIRFVTMDYPLGRDCNPYVSTDLHPAACLSAAAAREAAATGSDSAFEEWLWTNQAGLSRTALLSHLAARSIVVSDNSMSLVRASIEAGQRAGVSATPTYFVNGIKVPTLDSTQMEVVIRHELQAAAVQK